MAINEKAAWAVFPDAEPDNVNITKPVGRLGLICAHSFERADTEVAGMTWGGLAPDAAVIAVQAGDVEKENAGIYFWSQDTIGQYVSDVDATAGLFEIQFNEGNFAGVDGGWGYVWLSAAQDLSLYDSDTININGNDGGNTLIGPMDMSANGDYLIALVQHGNAREHTWSSAMVQISSASDVNNWTHGIARASAAFSAGIGVTLNNGNAFDRVMVGILIREAGLGGPALSYQSRRRRSVA